MNLKSKKSVALIVSGLLLTGVSAGTFALWNVSQSAQSGTISSGAMDVAITGITWEDATNVTGTAGDGTALVSGAGPIASPNDFRVVPGDTVIGTYTTAVALDGSHALADLKVAVNADTLPEGFKLDYRANGGEWNEITDDSTISFRSSNFVGTAPGTIVATNLDLGAITDDDADTVAATVDVEVRAYFDSATSGRTSMNESVSLGGLQVVLTQVAAK